MESFSGDGDLTFMSDGDPVGLGVYVRNLDRRFRARRTPQQFAKRMKDHGFRNVWLQACWSDHRGHRESNRGQVRPYAEACAAAGLTVGLWGFPSPVAIEPYFDSMVQRASECGGGVDKGGVIQSLLHDPELPWKVKGGKHREVPMSMRGQGEAIEGDGLIDSMEELNECAHRFMGADAIARQEIGVPSVGNTSYGMAAWHPIPYEIFAQYGWQSPQLYSVTPSQVAKGIKQWRDLGAGYIVPSVPAFGKNSGPRLAAHLDAFVPHGIKGAIVWSSRQISAAELRTLQAFSERHFEG